MAKLLGSLESPIAMTLRPGEADNLAQLEHHTYYWTGWRWRHWPADVVRPGVLFYGFDTRERSLQVLLKVTRGGTFTYKTKREFEDKVKFLTGWRPDRRDPHWKNVPAAGGGRFNTGIAMRWRVIKGVHIPIDVRFPRLGWLNLRPNIRIPWQDVDPAEEFLEGEKHIRRHMRTERNSRLRARSKDLWRSRMGQIQCVVCGFNFEQHYGEIGCDFIEMHHEAPLSILHGPRLVTPEHLKPVCANCHRMIHRQRPFLPTRNVKLAITKARSNKSLKREAAKSRHAP
jgi:hypothetical protein